MKTIQELVDLIELEKINETTFKGYSQSIGSPNVFGGQALAQALNAAYRTVPENRYCHSLHCYFILPGNLEKEIIFKVQLVRNGGSFTTRHVSAEQDGKSIFVLTASFQIQESGYEHQQIMPDVPDPEDLLSWEEIYEQNKDFLPKSVGEFLKLDRPFIFKQRVINNPFERKNLEPTQDTWFKFRNVPENLSIQHFQQVLAYASDYNILVTALHPHASTAHFKNMQLASLDHAIWFHRNPTNYNDWFLYHVDNPSNSNARGFTIGKIFDKKGNLIASVTQEGLMRSIKK